MRSAFKEQSGKGRIFTFKQGQVKPEKMSFVQDKGVEEGNHLDIKAYVRNTGETSGMKLTEQNREAEDMR